MPLWMSGKKYKQDQQIMTKSSGGTPKYAQWRVRADHTAVGTAGTVGGDIATAGTALAPAILNPANYDQVVVGEIYSVDSIELSADASETSYKFMREKQARATSTPNPVSITVTLFSMADRQNVERFFARVNASAYIEICEAPNPKNPHVSGVTGIKISGQARLASSTKSFPSDAGNITKTLVFNADGGTFFEEEYIAPTSLNLPA